ncbi:uncharacterized protein ACR2FA_012218 [Aphomia sociella]
MASEDVIELGSSEDEAEPAPKKIKPRPNAMVHIPTKLHGVTIKPAISNTSINKKLTKGAVTLSKVQKSNTVCNPFSNRGKINGKPQQKNPIKQTMKPIHRPVHLSSKPAVNPVNIFKKINSQVIINKLPTTGTLLNPIRIHTPQSLNKLPPSITITRTIGPTKRTGVSQATNLPRKKQKQNNLINTNEVLTVELDDDDSSVASTASPAWYLRPEEQVEGQLEKENNEEPQADKLIEITIEDSPVKPPAVKQIQKVESQLEVIIEDSPVKVVEEKKKTVESGSEEEGISFSTKSPHSKKKLEYPKESKENKVIEIEIEPIAMEPRKETNLPEKTTNVTSFDIVEIEESPIKEIQQTSTPKKEQLRQQVQFPESMLNEQIDKEKGDFHPVYQRFIDLCFELENSDDMNKIIEKKVKMYYKQVPKDYTESEEFIDMVSSKILAMKAAPEKMYLFIKDIVDELNMQRKMAKSQVTNTENKAQGKAADNFLYGENSEYDSKRQRQIRKLEKTLKKLHRAIQKLEEQEVDFDDEEDSVYLLTERYKERMVRVHAKFCQLTNTKMPSEPRVQIDARPGQPSGPAKRLEKWINKKVPIGTPLPFPDFHDVLRCVRDANESDKLGLNEADIMEEARDLFTRCGKKLQRRRQENEWRLAASRISVDTDPADNNDDLKLKLTQNHQLATKKETELFNKYADKQNQLKLEPEEIGDKEAEESPVESEDEDAEPADEALLENKDRRKDRLKRLLQEKSKKGGDGNQEIPDAEDKENSPVDTHAPTEREQTVDGVSKSENTLKETALEEELKEIDNTNKCTSSTVPDENESKDTDNIISHSDNDYKVESDIDELHLLQKLHSENEVNSSTSEFSDLDTPVSISDTLEDSDDDKLDNSDVISIEDSSYSESEINRSAQSSTKSTDVIHTSDKIVTDVVNSNDKDNKSNAGIEKKLISTNNDEYTDCNEDILLTSTDDEADVNKEENLENDQCVNLEDDHLSIGDTVIEGINKDRDTILDQSHLSVIPDKNNTLKTVADDINMPMGPGGNDKNHDLEKSLEENNLSKKDEFTHNENVSSSIKERNPAITNKEISSEGGEKKYLEDITSVNSDRIETLEQNIEPLPTDKLDLGIDVVMDDQIEKSSEENITTTNIDQESVTLNEIVDHRSHENEQNESINKNTEEMEISSSNEKVEVTDDLLGLQEALSHLNSIQAKDIEADNV